MFHQLKCNFAFFTVQALNIYKIDSLLLASGLVSCHVTICEAVSQLNFRVNGVMKFLDSCRPTSYQIMMNAFAKIWLFFLILYTLAKSLLACFAYG